MSIDLPVQFNMYYVGFRALKSPAIWNVLGYLRAFKSLYVNACRVNSNTLLKTTAKGS